MIIVLYEASVCGGYDGSLDGRTRRRGWLQRLVKLTVVGLRFDLIFRFSMKGDVYPLQWLMKSQTNNATRKPGPGKQFSMGPD